MQTNQEISSSKELCAFCFDVIISKLQNLDTPKYPTTLPKFSAPLFVTWNIFNNKERELRGCIGILSIELN